MPCSYYVDLISKEGLIGIVLAQSPEFVAPHGAKQPIFGTNPIGISIPAQVGARQQGGAPTCAFRSYVTEGRMEGAPAKGTVTCPALR